MILSIGLLAGCRTAMEYNKPGNYRYSIILTKCNSERKIALTVVTKRATDFRIANGKKTPDLFGYQDDKKALIFHNVCSFEIESVHIVQSKPRFVQ